MNGLSQRIDIDQYERKVDEQYAKKRQKLDKDRAKVDKNCAKLDEDYANEKSRIKKLRPLLVDVSGAKAVSPKTKASSARPMRSIKRDIRQPRDGTKAAGVLKLLQRSGGASIAEIAKATGWQDHTIRSFVNSVLGKKLGFHIQAIAANGTNSQHRYSIPAF